MPETTADALIGSPDRPRFENVEYPKQDEADHDPQPTGWRGDHGDEVTNHLVPDDGG